jgi:hypothetical protein
MRKIDGEQVLMRIFVGESDRAGHRALHVALHGEGAGPAVRA